MLPLFDNIPTRRFPLATYALIAANFAVWFWELGSRAGRINHYAFYPCAVLFLFIFGNNVEDVTGRIRFVVFYIAGGFAAALTQTFVTLHWSGTAAASIPNVGASGAIAAVLGAYLVLLPHARVTTLLFGFLPWRISAGVFLIVWFVFQLWQSNFSITHANQGGGVAFAAHVGGFAFGFLAIKAFQVRPPLRPRQSR